MDWFLNDRDIHNERVELKVKHFDRGVFRTLSNIYNEAF